MLHQLQCLLYVERDRHGRWTRGKGLFAKLQQSCWRNRGGVYLKYSYTNSKNYFFPPRILIRKWACVISLLALRKVCELSVRIRNSKPQTPGMGRVFIQSHIYGVPTAHTDEDYVSNHHAHPLPVLPPPLSLYSHGTCETIFLQVPAGDLHQVYLAFVRAFFFPWLV